MGLIYSVSVLFFTFMIFRMYLKKDIRPYMTSRVVTLLTILGLLPYVNTVIIIATLGDAGKHTGENKEVNACLVELGL